MFSRTSMSATAASARTTPAALFTSTECERFMHLGAPVAHSVQRAVDCPHAHLQPVPAGTT
eukprot:m.60140 g.60140  ORF g.60140 m.60140 type:complete len:61 (+) comp9493_c0_seq4:406-588(+)